MSKHLLTRLLGEPLRYLSETWREPSLKNDNCEKLNSL